MAHKTTAKASCAARARTWDRTSRGSRILRATSWQSSNGSAPGLKPIAVSYGQPAPGVDTLAVSSWPVRPWSPMLAGPAHSRATMKSVLRSAPPSMQAQPPIRQTAVGSDVEGREFVGVGLGEDQRGVVGRHDQTVREGHAIRHLSSRAGGGDESQKAWGEFATREVEADIADVGVAPSVDDDVVPGMARKLAQIGVRHHRAVRLSPDQASLTRGHDEQAPISKPVDAKWKRRHPRHDLASALEIHGNELLCAPV